MPAEPRGTGMRPRGHVTPFRHACRNAAESHLDPRCRIVRSTRPAPISSVMSMREPIGTSLARNLVAVARMVVAEVSVAVWIVEIAGIVRVVRVEEYFWPAT